MLHWWMDECMRYVSCSSSIQILLVVVFVTVCALLNFFLHVMFERWQHSEGGRTALVSSLTMGWTLLSGCCCCCCCCCRLVSTTRAMPSRHVDSSFTTTGSITSHLWLSDYFSEGKHGYLLSLYIKFDVCPPTSLDFHSCNGHDLVSIPVIMCD